MKNKLLIILSLILSAFFMPIEAQINQLNVRTTNGAIPSSCTTTSRFYAVTYKFNDGIYQCIGGTYTKIGGTAVGATVSGAVANQVFYGGTGGTLAQNPNLAFDPSTSELKITAGSINVKDFYGTGSNVIISAYGSPLIRNNVPISWTVNLGLGGSYATSGIVGKGTATTYFTDGGNFPGSISTGGLETGIVSKTAAYTVGDNDHIILVDSTSGTRTITLRTAVGITGREYIVKDWKGTASTNNITINTTSGQTIDGVATRVLNSNYSGLRVVSDGANYVIF